jgi:hypothetical protein
MSACGLCDGTGSPGPYRDDAVCPKCNGSGVLNEQRAVYVVDWDGTCVEEVWPGMGDWLPGAVESLRWLQSRGKTVIYSLRCHLFEEDDVTRREPYDVDFEVNRIRLKLDRAGLEDIEIYPPNRGKPPGKFYIDDRGVHFNGDWDAVLKEVQERE